MGFLLGSAYAVSAGLVIYALERGIFSSESAPTLIVIWSISGLVLALLAVLLRRPEK